MPLIHITLVEGRDDARVQACVREMARVAADMLDAPLSAVRVWVDEIPANRFAVGDQLKSDPAPAAGSE